MPRRDMLWQWIVRQEHCHVRLPPQKKLFLKFLQIETCLAHLYKSLEFSTTPNEVLGSDYKSLKVHMNVVSSASGSFTTWCPFTAHNPQDWSQSGSWTSGDGGRSFQHVSSGFWWDLTLASQNWWCLLIHMLSILLNFAYLLYKGEITLENTQTFLNEKLWPHYDQNKIVLLLPYFILIG